MPAADGSIDAALLPSLRDRPCLYPDGAGCAGQAWAGRSAYVYAGGQATPLGPQDDPAALLVRLGGAGPADRIRVLAVGSNAYPRQLLDKFREHAVRDDSVLTVSCTAPGVAVAYVAALSRWGYVPVGLRSQPGAECATWVQLLTVEQLAAIARTEGKAYRLVRVPGVVTAALDGLDGLGGWGVGEGGATVYGWAHARLLAWDGDVPETGAPGSDLAGVSPAGAGALDVASMGQRALLARLVEAVLPGLEWDGCRLPETARGPIDAWLRGRAMANDLPAAWRPLDRDAADFPDCLLR